MLKVFALFAITTFVLAGTFIEKGIQIVQSVDIPEANFGLLAKLFEPKTIVFTGDIMLGRSVERTIDEHTVFYPFSNLMSYLSSKDIAIGNFEASVPLKHVPTPSNGMTFSVRKEFVPSLYTVGFDILSLANNHALDYGVKGYENTKNVCSEANLVCFGHPSTVSTSSIHVARVGDTLVGMIFLHANYGQPTEAELTPLVNELNESSDIQIAYIHWGEEYVPTHNKSQSVLAHFLIDNGIDSVIGHHPHVVQDIERYRGKPIFYSLGNLIFDQYFSVAVQEGFFVEMTLKKREILYTLIPYESTTTRSQPKFLDDIGRQQFYKRLLPFTFFTEDEQLRGSFNVSRD